MVSDLVVISKQTLTPAQFSDLADVPPELEWLANITNPKTRRAYKMDVSEFSTFTGLREPTQLRTVTRARVIAWRKHLESRKLAPSSIRRKLSALSSLFDYLCDRNAVPVNPADGVKRPMANNNVAALRLGRRAGAAIVRGPCNIVIKYARETGIIAEAIGVCVHSMRATAATNALSNGAHIAKVQEWLGHANISTTRLYDRRKSKP